MTAAPPPPHDPGSTSWQPSNPPVPPAPRGGWFARNKLLTALLGIGLLSLLCCGASLGGLLSLGGEDSPTTSGSSDEASRSGGSKDAKGAKSAEDDTLPAIGSKVRDGKFEFTVTDVKTGVASVGEDFLVEKAQGQFVLVDITVSNIGDEAQTMFDSEQKVVDAEGRSFAASSAAAIAIEGNSDVWISQINPGNTVEGTLVFDMPKGAEPVKIELHDSMFSDGVEVSLTR